ncbi:unnamed protein product, partial [Staurois parvus]
IYIYIYIVTVWRSVTPGFSTRQVEGLQSKCLIQRKVAFHFPHLFVRSILGHGAWRFQSDLGGMKSLILGPGFGNGQTLIAQVCAGLFHRGLTMILGSTPAGQETVGLHPGRQEVSALESRGLHQ